MEDAEQVNGPHEGSGDPVGDGLVAIRDDDMRSRDEGVQEAREDPGERLVGLAGDQGPGEHDSGPRVVRRGEEAQLEAGAVKLRSLMGETGHPGQAAAHTCACRSAHARTHARTHTVVS